MKKLILLIAFLLPVLLYGQNTFKYRVDANGGLTIGGAAKTEIDSAKVVGTHFAVWDGAANYFAISDTALFAKLAGPTFTGTVVLPATTSIGTVDNTEISYVNGVTSAIQTQFGAKMDTGNNVAIEDDVVMLLDTTQLFVFGAGGGNAGDTSVFTTSTIYGSFFNESRDTLMITSLRVVMLGDATDTLSVDILWDANLNDGTPTELNTNPFPVNSITSGDEDTSFANQKIPPDVWVWCETPGVTAGKKPTYFNAQISGYIKRTE
jgi:hypothetical protein